MRAGLTTLLLLAALPTTAATVTKIDIPGASDTYVGAISPTTGIIGGSYIPSGSDPCGRACGFLQAADGTVTTFSVFHATNVGVNAVADDGTAVGVYIQSLRTRGFIRTPDGTVADVFFPKTYTAIRSITPTGVAMGTILGGDDGGFLRTPDGTVTKLAIKGCPFSTLSNMNAAGTITGLCLHKSKGFAFLRTLDGKSKRFKPHDWDSAAGIYIDDAGAIVGGYTEKVSGVRGDFIREADGTIHTFAPIPGPSVYITGMGTAGTDRQVVGWLMGDQERISGFIHHANGTDEIFDVSGATAPQSGTYVTGISPSGVITGYTFDDQLRTHGFVRTP
jgi:hypothetical protein